MGWIRRGISNFLSPYSCIPGEAANISGRQWVACLGYLFYDELLVYLAMHIAWTYMYSSNIKYFWSPNFKLFFLPVSSWKQWNKNLTQKAWPKISENLVQQKLPVFYTFLAIPHSWIEYSMRSFQNLLVPFKSLIAFLLILGMKTHLKVFLRGGRYIFFYGFSSSVFDFFNLQDTYIIWLYLNITVSSELPWRTLVFIAITCMRWDHLACYSRNM